MVDVNLEMLHTYVIAYVWFKSYAKKNYYQLYNINNNVLNLWTIYLVGIFVLCSQTKLYEQQWVSVPHL